MRLTGKFGECTEFKRVASCEAVAVRSFVVSVTTPVVKFKPGESLMAKRSEAGELL